MFDTHACTSTVYIPDENAKIDFQAYSKQYIATACYER